MELEILEETTEQQKVKVLDDPEVYTVDNYLTDEECAHFIQLSKPNLQRALVSGQSKGYVSQGRSGQNCWIKHDTDEITRRVGDKIAKVVGVPLENAEAFQIIYYGVTQEYRQHYDGWEHNNSEKTLRNMKFGGQRLWTGLCYLNDVEEGGGTKFTRLNTEVQAKKGRLLVFKNTVEGSHVRHPLSEHAGMPVIKGEKYAFNLWFREYPHNKLYREFNPEYYMEADNAEKNKDIKEIEELIKKQNKDKKIINPEMIEIESNKKESNKKETVKIETDKTEKSNQLIQMSNYKLEEYDYIPFMRMNCDRGSKDMHNFVDTKWFLFVCVTNIDDLSGDRNVLQQFMKNYHTIICYQNGDWNKMNGTCNHSIKSTNFTKMFSIPDAGINIYVVSPNRKIMDVINTETLSVIPKEIDTTQYSTNVHIPYLVVENVLSDALLKKILKYYDDNVHRATLHNTGSKNRLHVHPNKELEKELDNKLSRSLFPELRKVYYFDVHYRELYKICSYDAATSGRFHPHRDTPHPFQHRRYALSLFLNDDYEGGDFVLPEYGLKVKPKANTAFVFPGICSHQVEKVLSGSRKTIISFFCSEIEGKTKNNSTYTVKSHFFDENKTQFSRIFPF